MSPWRTRVWEIPSRVLAARFLPEGRGLPWRWWRRLWRAAPLPYDRMREERWEREQRASDESLQVPGRKAG